jgi:hypothetical protein
MGFLPYALVTLAAFTAMPLCMRSYLRVRVGTPLYKTFVPVYLAGTAVVSLLVSLLLSPTLVPPPTSLLEAAGLGLLYAAASYLLYYALEHEKAGPISAIGGSQQLLIAFFRVYSLTPGCC